MRAEAHPVRVSGLETGLAAYAAVEQVADAAGGIRDRVDKRRQLRYDHVWVRTPATPPASAENTALTERDLRWLVTTSKARRGQRAEALAGRAALSGLFRLLYELDWSDATARLGRLIAVEPRPDAQTVLRDWLARLENSESRLASQLIDAVPTCAKAWATHEAPRLIAAATPSNTSRTALTHGLCAVAAHLPAHGIPLSVLAEQSIHRTHGLDPDTTLGRVSARLAAAVAGQPPPATAAHVREAWEAVGVWLDRISSQASGWCLPLNPGHPAAAVAAAYQAANEPAVLTIGVLTAGHAPLVTAAPPGGATLWVVEGVSVLTAVAASRVRAPVLCRGGTPSVAVTRLTTAAIDAGWRVAVSSDFEPGGLRGAIALLRHSGNAAHPWRLSAADYLAAPAEGEPFPPEQVPDTPWDPSLAEAMRHRCERVSEEGKLQALLDDLISNAGRHSS